MPDNKLYIKNMVCNRCILVVSEQLERLGFSPESVELGVVAFNRSINDSEKKNIENALVPLGFELIDDRRIRIVEQVKKIIIELIYNKSLELKVNLSDYLSRKMNMEYSTISNLFSEMENTTIEKYFIAQKIERVKELLVYDELSLNEIAYLLQYSSTAHLSAQFKKITGLTPSHFKKIGENKRKPIDLV